MPFLTQPTQPLVSGEGPDDARVVFVGEAPGLQEERAGRPFIGPAGQVLEQCMHNAGLVRAQCYITNVIKERPPGNIIKPFFTGSAFTEAGQRYVAQLKEELTSRPTANIIIAVGGTALFALTGQKQIMKRRGYIHESTLIPGKKILPIIHPSATFSRRRQGPKKPWEDPSGSNPYLYRYYITHDLRKAKRESGFPEIRLPLRTLTIPQTYSECLGALQSLRHKSPISVDIEVANDEVSCIGFCHEPLFPITIPLYHRWTNEEETEIWRHIAYLLEDVETCKIFQNGIFDISFLFQKNRILVQGPIEDTMIAHSVTFPEFLKGLEFLASIYSNQQYWKDMAKATGEKKDA